MMMPAHPMAYFVVGQPGFTLATLQAFFNAMCGLRHPGKGGQRGLRRSIGEVILKCCSNNAMEPLRAAYNQADKGSGARESLAQLIFIAFNPTNLRQLLEHTTFFFLGKKGVNVTLFFANALDVRRHSRRRHVEQDIGAIHPVNMGLHGSKGGRRDILKGQMHLDIFMKKFDRPTQPIP